MNINITFDKNHIWHPYTSMSNPLPCYEVVRAEGVYIELKNGKKLIDGMSSWWAVIQGYNHPKLNQAIYEQIPKMSHVMFGGITHKPAISLCKKLISMTPKSLDCIFLADSGSVSVEVALKMAHQYWQAKGQKRTEFIALKHAYHGDTFGAMSVSDPINSMHHLYGDFLPKHNFVDYPICGFYDNWDQNDIKPLQICLEKKHKDIAALILEPIVQGAGGMRIYHPEYLKQAKKLCEQYGILLIADEIATGFGRTGKLFAFEHSEIVPDILCLGKALTGGYMTLSATITSRHIANTISNGESKCFMHGPTFMGNPLACSVADANLSLLENENWKNQVKQIEQQLISELLPISIHHQAEDVRVLGAIGVIQTKHQIDVAKAQQFFVDSGVWIRPFGKLLYIMPPYIILKEELKHLISVMKESLDQDIFV